MCLTVLSLSVPLFPAEPEEKQKEILNNTIPEGKDSGDLPVFILLSAAELMLLCHCFQYVYIQILVWYSCWTVSGL